MNRNKAPTFDRLRQLDALGEVTWRDMARVCDMSVRSLRGWVTRNIKRGVLVRVRRGVFVVAEGIRL